MNIVGQICVALMLILVLIIVTLPAGVVMMLCLIFNSIGEFFRNLLTDIINYLQKVSNNISPKN